jgi:hypothetical protein
MEFKETIWENHPEWDTIEFNGKWTHMEISSVDKDGDIGIEIIRDGDPSVNIFLNQENIKQLISHLQKQIK